ncbi:MAG: response regulator [Betaproteobacteria bacterium]
MINSPMTPNSDDKFCTTREAAEQLGVSLRTAQLWSESGLLEAWKTEGGHRRISLESVQRVLAQKQPVLESREEVVGQLKVMVVEDDNVLLKLYRMCLTSWGLPIEVITASNGYEALVLIGRESPDLMITDLSMDGIDGFQMVRTLNSSPFKEGMEMVVVSGLDAAAIEERGGLPAGVPVYPKPIPFNALRILCQKLLDRRRAALEKL